MHQRVQREELAMVLSALHGEFHQEVFIAPPKPLGASGISDLVDGVV